MSVLANLIVKMSADTSALERGLKGAKGSMDKFKGVLKAGALAGGAALAGLGVASLKMGMDFEKTMAEVKTLMPDISEKAFGKMKDDVLAFSKEMGIATEKAVPALYQAISAGVPRQNVMEFMKVASKTAIGGVTDLETAVDGLTTVVNAFGLEASEVGRVADVMFTGVKLGKTTIAELSTSMFQAAPLAASLGLKIEDVVAATTTLTKSGTPTAQAMTQIRQAMVALAKPNTDMISLLKKTAYASGEALLQSEGFAGALDILTEAAGGNKEVIAKAFGSVEALQAVLGLTGDAALGAAKDLAAVTDSAGAAEKAFATISETTAFKLNKAINAVKVEMTKLGAEVLPVLIGGFENLEQIAADLTPILEDMDKQTQFLTSGLDDLQEDVADIGKAFGNLEGDMRIWIDVAVAALKLGAFPLVLGFRAIVETMGIVAALFRGEWSDALDHFRELTLVPLKTAWWALGDVISTVMLGIGRVIESGINAIIPMLNTFIDWINSATGAVNAFSGLLGLDKLKIGTIPTIDKVNLRLGDFESFLRGSTDAMRDLGLEAGYIDPVLRRFAKSLAAGDGGGPGVDGGGGGGDGGGGGGALAQAVDILTPGMAALNAEVEREEVFLVNVAKALTTATTQHDSITEAITTTEKALADATKAMSDWENAALKGSRAFSDMAFGISQDMDRLQLKMNEVSLGVLEEGLVEGGYASDALERKIRKLADTFGIELFGGKLDWGDIQKVLDAAGLAMEKLGLESRNVNLRESLSLGDAQRKLDQFFEDQAGYAEHTLPEIIQGWSDAKDEAALHAGALEDWNAALIVNEIHMTFLQGLLNNHQTYLANIRDLYREIEQAAQDAWAAAAQLPAGTSVTPALPAAVPVYHEGGYVPRTGLAMLRAGEQVIAPGGGSGAPIHYHNHFNGPLLGDRRQLEAVARALRPYFQRDRR